MKPRLTILLALLAVEAIAQEPYRCKQRDGSWVIQDAPCKVAPVSVPAAAGPQQAPAAMDAFKRAESDKAKADEMRYQRQKRESLDNIARCDAIAYDLQQQVSAIAAEPTTEYRPNAVGIAAMRLEEERKQTAMSAAQSQAAAKRDECAKLRQDHDKRFLK